MTVTGGTGVGGTAQPPGIIEREATAFTVNMQATLGIVPDSLEVPVGKLDPQTRFKYDTTAARPSLRPIETLRMGAELAVEDSSFKKYLEEFIALLSPSDQEGIEKKRPQHVILEALLEIAAKAFTQIDVIKEERVSDIQAESLIAKETLKQREEVKRLTEELLPVLGANDPHYDALVAKYKAL
jgi:hypothetical protein